MGGRVLMQGRNRGREDGVIRGHVLVIAALALVIGACASQSENGGSDVGVVPGGTGTTSGPVDTVTTSTAATSITTGIECGVDEVCQIEVPLIQIPLDVTPTSISIDGDRAWLAAPDAASVVEIDLAGAAVARTIPVGDSATDVVAGAGSLWVVTYEFSFGPMLRVDPSDGSTLATIDDPSGDARSVVVVDDSVWAVADGYGTVMRIDTASNAVTDVVGGTDFAGGAGEVSIVAGNGTLWAIDESTGSVERIDVDSRTIESTIGGLGYSEEASGGSTSILSDGAKALAFADAGLWVLSDVPNPNGEPNVVGGAALFLLDPETGAVIRRIDLILEPNFGRPGLAITDDAAWYFDFVNGYPVRVDLETERQTFIRLETIASAIGVVTDGTTVWFALDAGMVVGIDAAAAAQASESLSG